jgi:cytoskeleton protein RodZ
VFEIGNSLREARERRGIGFAHAEQATKIRGKYLRALEEERFDLLPSETYVKGFLRGYSDYLGLDGQLYVDEYNSRFVTDDEFRARRSASRQRGRSRRAETAVVLGVLAAITIVTVVVITAWSSSGGSHATPKAKKAAAVQQKKHVPPRPTLTIRGARGSSYVAVRRGGPAGAVVFQGTVAKGQSVPFRGKWFWLNVSAPENLAIKVRGNAVPLTGHRPRVITITPTRVDTE